MEKFFTAKHMELEALLERGLYDECFIEFKKLAKQGDPLAAHMVGQFYKDGYCVEQSYKKAVEWYIKAKDMGLPKSNYFIAFSYWFMGDKKASKQYFKLAEDDNELLALSYLGYAYMGLNDWDEYNLEKAVIYHKKAADVGCRMSDVEYCKLLLKGHNGFMNRLFIIPRLIKACAKLIAGFYNERQTLEMSLQSMVLAEKLDDWDRFN